MCLIMAKIPSEADRELGSFVAYKIFLRHFPGISPGNLVTPFRNFEIPFPGTVRATYADGTLVQREVRRGDDYIYSGIHVFLKRADCEEVISHCKIRLGWWDRAVVVPVKCLHSNVRAFGRWEDMPMETAVLTQITITQEAWDEALKLPQPKDTWVFD